MNLTPHIAEKIASRYAGSVAVYGWSQTEIAFREAMRRQGGLFAALTDDARRDFILTLGDNRRAHNRAYTKRFGKAPNTDELDSALNMAAE